MTLTFSSLLNESSRTTVQPRKRKASFRVIDGSMLLGV